MAYSSLQDIDAQFQTLADSQVIAPQSGHLFNPGYENANAIVIESAQGAYITDILGNRYIDVGMGAGSQILGHAPEPVVAKISEQAAKGSIYIQPSQSAYTLKEEILKNLPDEFSGVVFCSSGSEATMRAVRVARAYSNNTTIALFGGGWHGGHDAVLFGEDPDSPDTQPTPQPLSTGLPDYLKDDVLVLPYNKQEAFDSIRQEAHRLALVIVEPVQGSNPRSDIAGFLRDLQKTCRDSGVLLAFDEIITGFRLCYGGAVEHFKVSPDIITYGKILGGGLPAGAVIIHEKIADRVFAKSAESFFTGGTFSANPLTMTAGIEVLKTLKVSNYDRIGQFADHMRTTMNAYFIEHKFPLRMIGCQSMSRVVFTDQNIDNRRMRDRYELAHSVQATFRKLMILNGVLQPSNGIMFLSFAHEEGHVQKIIAALKRSAMSLSESGCFRTEVTHGRV